MFQLGSLKLDYQREGPNPDCERAVEVPLGRWFMQCPSVGTTEIGATMPYYGCQAPWVVDLYDPHEHCIREDAAKRSYVGERVLSLSTVEHVGFHVSDYKHDGVPQQTEDPSAAPRLLGRIIREAQAYLITLPVGFHRELDRWAVAHRRNNARFLRRVDPANNWVECDAGEALACAYGHPFKGGNALIVFTNQPELLGRPAPAAPMRLNLGAGETVLPGFSSWDVKDGRPAFPLAVPDNSVSEIYASHLLEHYPFTITVGVLRDWFRALVPGGRIRIAVPDLDKIIRLYLARAEGPLEQYLLGGHADEYDRHQAVFNAAKLVTALQRAGFVKPGTWAPVIRDCAALPISLNIAAFKPPAPAGPDRPTGQPVAPVLQPATAPSKVIGRVGQPACQVSASLEGPAPSGPVPPDCPAPSGPVPLEGPAPSGPVPLEGPAPSGPPVPSAPSDPSDPSDSSPASAQPAPAKTAPSVLLRNPQSKILAVWSTPRLGFMETFHCIYNSLPRFGIDLINGLGVYWGQRLESIMEMAIDRGMDLVLSLDSDAVFTARDLSDLIALIETHPEAQAVAAHQWNRAVDRPLWTLDGRHVNTGNPVRPEEIAGQDLFPVDTMHFGLTLFRCSALKALPHPWFHATPNDQGRWADGKTDDDIHFWRAFKAAGFRAFIAPKIVIGHLEMACRWPGPDLSVVWQHLYEYHNAGKPAGLFGNPTASARSA